jgi:sugar transferase EpsL
MLKRGLDLAIALILLIGLSPLLALLALAVRWKLGRPVLFAQTRPGLHGAPFEFYKFRTMTNARNQAGELLPDAARLTPFGNLMRKLSLDELPQLVNVLKGDMSLVGPRPLLMEYLPLYSARQAQRHAVRPGITGWAQVNGRNALGWEERFELDLWYVEHRSLWLDLRIIAMTAWRMLRPQGIARPGHATMSKFTGSRHGREN